MASILQTPVHCFSCTSNLSSNSQNQKAQLWGSISNSNFKLRKFSLRALKEKTEEIKTPEEITKKYGLEAGLWKVIFASVSVELVDLWKLVKRVFVLYELLFSFELS